MSRDADTACPRCGAPRPTAGWEGLCPACLARVSLAATLAAPGDAAATTGATSIPAERHVFPGDLGDYELLGEIGRGGMGVVYKARQRRLDRLVALKLILSGRYSSPQDIHRFRAEAMAAARLHHPNIVAVYETGELEGRPYFSMELVEGDDLATLVRLTPLPWRQAARHAVAIARAIGHAHEHGVIHRDLKPSNVLIDREGQVRVTDFGLAKVTSADSDLTVTGQTLGSPNYLAPEQIAAARGQVGPACDIYAVGAILYQLLTGRPPFVGENLESTLLRVLDADPVSPRRLNPEVPVDLETICLKCLQKSPHRRYATASGLVEDLDRLLNGEPILARRVPAWERAWLWARRRPAVAASLAVAILGVGVGFSLTLWQWQRAEMHATRLGETLARMEFEQAERFFGDNQPHLALGHLARMLRVNPHDRPAVSRALSALNNRAFLLPIAPPMRHNGAIRDAQFSPDATLVLSGSADHTARFWHTRTAEPVGPPLLHEGEVLHVGFDARGRHAVTTSTDGTARTWIVETATALGPPLRHRGPVNWGAFNPDGTLVVTASDDHTAQVWEVATSSPRGEAMFHSRAVWLAAFSPDGRLVLTTTEGGTARLWGLDTREARGPPMEHAQAILYAEFSPDGRCLATASRDGSARLWDVQTGQPVGAEMKHRFWVFKAVFSPDGRRLATAGNDATARVWSVPSGLPITEPLAHESNVLDLAFSPNGSVLVTACQTGQARLYDAITGALLACPIHHAHSIVASRFSRDGKVLTASVDGTAAVWNTGNLKMPTTKSAGGVPVGTFRALPHPAGVTWADWSPDGKWVVTLCRDAHARIWEAAALTNAATDDPQPTLLLPHDAVVVSAAFSPDSRQIATASRDGFARVWDVQTGEPLRSPFNHDRIVWNADFSRDGRWLVTASSDRTARVWSLADRAASRPVRDLPHPDGVNMAVFSPEDDLVVTAGVDHTARIWRWKLEPPVSIPLRHQANVIHAEFSPDGQRVATASYDRTARIWDAHTGRPLTPPLRHQAEVGFAFFHPDGARLITGTQGGVVRLWNVFTGQPTLPALRLRSRIREARFSPDGLRFAAATDAGLVRLFELRWGHPISEMLRHQDVVHTVRFSPDGNWLLTASDDGNVRLWPTPWPPGPVPEWFPETLAAIGGLTLDDEGRIQRTPHKSIPELRAQMRRSGPGDWYARWMDHFLARYAAFDSPPR